MLKAINVAKFFIKEGCDTPRDTLDGNMKLQKLLYFSQLIHLARHGEVLFEDPICAFKNGSVVESVRLEYKNNIQKLVEESTNMNFNFNDEEIKTLKIVMDVFGDLDAEELSELNHLHQSWKKAYNRSKINNYHYKSQSIISIQDMIEYDLENINKILEAYEMTAEFEQKYEEINGVKFYYDPNEITIDKDLLNYLNMFPAEEKAYTICIDEGLGVIIY